MAGWTPVFICVPVSNSVRPLPPLSCRVMGWDGMNGSMEWACVEPYTQSRLRVHLSLFTSVNLA